MKPSLQWRDRVSQVSHAIRDEFDQLVASIQAGWNVEHDSEGHHLDVTATRVRAGSLGLTGRFVANAAQLTTLAPLIVPPLITLVEVSTGAAAVDLQGLQQAGAQLGDCILLCARGSSDLRLHGLVNTTVAPGTVPIGTEVVWDFLFQPVSPHVLSASSFRSPILMMYLPRAGTNTASAWGILRGIT